MPIHNENPVTRALSSIANAVIAIADLKNQNPHFDVQADITAYMKRIADPTEFPEPACVMLSVMIKNIMAEPSFSTLSPTELAARLTREGKMFFDMADKEYRIGKLSETTIHTITADPDQRRILNDHFVTRSHNLEYNQNATIPFTPQQERDFAEMRAGLDSIGIKSAVDSAQKYTDLLEPISKRIYRAMDILGASEPKLSESVSNAVFDMDLTYIRHLSTDAANYAPRDIQETLDHFTSGLSTLDAVIKNTAAAEKPLPNDVLADLTTLRDLGKEIKTKLLDTFEQEGENRIADASHRNISWSKSSSTQSR